MRDDINNSSQIGLEQFKTLAWDQETESFAHRQRNRGWEMYEMRCKQAEYLIGDDVIC